MVSPLPASLFVAILAFLYSPPCCCSFSSESERQLFPYQSAGAKRLVADRKVLLADQMGLGKTIQAISGLNRLAELGEIQYDRVLIISPKSVLNVWVDELNDWLDPRLELDVRVCTAGSSPEDPSVKGIIQLINYDICDKHKDTLQASPYDVVICDEAHYLKSHKSKRTKAILGNIAERKGAKTISRGIQSRYLWLLTGTPIMNRPIELYPLLYAIDPEVWRPMSQFIERYCEPKTYRGGKGRRWGVNANGASNLGELQDRLKPYMIRRYKADVLSDLPPKLKSCVNLSEGSSIAAAQERQMVAELMGMGDIMYSPQDTLLDEDEFAQTQSGGPMLLETFGADASPLTEYGIKASDFEDERFLGALAKIRKETAILKIEPAVNLLKDVIACEKVVVFAHHRQIILDLVGKFGDQAVHIIGGMDQERRGEAVKRFQNDESCRVFIGSIRAAGVGVTLTAASHVVFLEMDWSPSVMAQAEDRCHRVGQKDSVLCQYYVFRDTIDEWIARQLISKQVITTMALPTNTDGDSTQRPSANYQFDFGKHQGVRLEDVPESYMKFLIGNELVWRKRPALWRALYVRGLVRDEPPTTEIIGGDDDQEGDEEPTNVDYTFTFGKYNGEEWDDVPASYRGWILDKGVWKSRPDMKKALLNAGIID